MFQRKDAGRAWRPGILWTARETAASQATITTVTAEFRLRQQLLDYALGLPGARLDHPWGEDVVKVGKKVVVFFGMPEGSAYPAGMTVKLVDSQPLALAQPGAAPAGYNLGKSGWVTVTFGADMSHEMLREWIDESYRAVAPKKLVVELEGR